MNRRAFLHVAFCAAFLPKFAGGQSSAPKISEKDILKEGQPAAITHYCLKPEKQPNKICPNWVEKKGHCDTCQFYKADTKTQFKGSEHAKCLLLADPARPQFVQAKAWCAQFVPKAGAQAGILMNA